MRRLLGGSLIGGRGRSVGVRLASGHYRHDSATVVYVRHGEKALPDERPSFGKEREEKFRRAEIQRRDVEGEEGKTGGTQEGEEWSR